MIQLDLAEGDRGRGHVKHEAITILAGRGQRQRIRAERSRARPRRIHQRRRVRKTHPDKALLGGLHGIVPGYAVVVRSIRHHHAYADLFGFPDGQLHAECAHHGTE